MTKIDIFKIICFFNFLIFSNIFADEFGISSGINSSFHPKNCACAASLDADYNYRSNNHAEYQKTDYLNPFGFFYIKDFTNHFGLYSSLQISKMSKLEAIPKTEFYPDINQMVVIGDTFAQNNRNYASFELSPRFVHKFNKIIIEARAGLCGNAYINETFISVGKDSTFRSNDMRPFVLSLVCGIGTGYTIRNRFIVGVKSSVSKTRTNLYKEYGESYFFLNWHNVLYASINL